MKTARMATPKQETVSGLTVEKIDGQKIKVTMMMEVTHDGGHAPGRIELSGRAPDGMRIARVSCNGQNIYSEV